MPVKVDWLALCFRIMDVSEDEEKLELVYLACATVKWYRNLGKQ